MRKHLKRLVVSGFLVALVVAAGILVIFMRNDSRSAAKTTTPKAYDPVTQASALERHARLKLEAANARPRVLLIGDSLTERWEREGANPWNRTMLPLGAFNAGIDNDRTENVLWRIQDGGIDLAEAPGVCVLLIGINNLAADGDTPYGVARGVEAIIGELLSRFPETHVIVLGILPAGSHSNTLLGGRVRANRRLGDLDLSSTTFLDVSEAFLSDKGGIASALSSDGLHLSKKGYETLAKIITPKIQKFGH